MSTQKDRKLPLFYQQKEEEVMSITQLNVVHILALADHGIKISQIAKLYQVGHNRIKEILVSRSAPLSRPSKLDAHATAIWDMLVRTKDNATHAFHRLGGKEVLGVKLRTFQDYIARFRSAYVESDKHADYAVNRTETHPGEQSQIDYGQTKVMIGGDLKTIYIFLNVLSYSRMMSASVSFSEKQEDWFAGLRKSFRDFGGVPRTVLSDNARALVSQPASEHNNVVLTREYRYFAVKYGFMANVAPKYTPYVKGKVERAIKYVKRSGVFDRPYKNLKELQQALDDWIKNTANERTIHDLDEPIKVPSERFKAEQALLHRLDVLEEKCDRYVERKLDDKGVCTYDGNRYYVGNKHRRQLAKVYHKGDILSVYVAENLVKELHIVNDRLIRKRTPVFSATGMIVGTFDKEQARELYLAYPDRFPELGAMLARKKEDVGKVKIPSNANRAGGTGQSTKHGFAIDLSNYNKLLGGKDV